MATTKDASARVMLQELGFTEIEARIYTFLLQNEPATGYRISHAIGKPTANTYKAVTALEGRGAVQVDEGESRLVRAVPPEELLAGLERRARDRHEAARVVLAELSRDTTDDRVYALKDVDQVLERARTMLGRADGLVLGDIFPVPLAALTEDLARAAERSVRVVVKTYAPVQVPGCETVPAHDGERALQAWPGQQLSLVVDADEHLLALFDENLAAVHQAVWSRSTFLSCLHHNHIAMELVSTGYDGARRGSLQAGDDAFTELSRISVLRTGTRGLERLRRRFGAASPIPTPSEE